MQDLFHIQIGILTQTLIVILMQNMYLIRSITNLHDPPNPQYKEFFKIVVFDARGQINISVPP